MNLGIFESVYGKYPIEEAAKKIREAGFKYIQFNPFFANGGNISPDDITKAKAKKIKETFEKEGIKIVGIGSYGRFVSPNEEEKNQIIEDTKKWIKLAKDFGTDLVVTEVGSKHATNNWLDCRENKTVKTWKEVVAVYKDLATFAAKYKVNVAIEPHFGQVVKDAKDLRKLLDDVALPNLKVAYDAANSVNAQNEKNQEQAVDEVFELLEKDIILVHAKDAVIKNKTTEFVPAGQGVIPYRKVLNALKEHNYNGPVLLEWVEEENVAEVKEYLEQQDALPYMIPLLKSDRELFENATKALELVHSKEGALDLKYRLLLSMVADALTRHPAGAIACGREALEAGATKEQVVEAIRVIYTAGGLPSLIENFDLYREVILK